ncbi:MAG: hypothetical protein IT561_12525 [Alphaproteobacteria bacterium]|nr:hypothetical protein [Alphaproteobacteria bacterium]
MPAYPGTVDWSGENPGMYLKDDPAGPFVTLLSFFRVVVSPYGRGHALLMLRQPQAAGHADNVCLTDNDPLARWLVSDFAASFGAFKGTPGMEGLRYAPLTHVSTSGDTRSAYEERVKGDDLDVILSWQDIGTPFALELPVGHSATGKHIMLSLFAGCGRAVATVNGTVLPGKPVPRDMVGRPITSAFLAFSETWIRP